jgi:chromosome segregation ATPase
MSETSPPSKTRRYEGLKIVATTHQPEPAEYDKPALMQKLQDARQQTKTARANIEVLQERVNDARQKTKTARAKTRSLEQQLSQVVNSVSWRITAPLRLAKQAIRSTPERMRDQQTRATDAHSSEGKDTNVES